MSIYVEYVILDNFIVDLLILYLVARTMHLRSNKWRIIVASVIGTIFALISPFMVLNEILMIMSKLCLGVIMIYIIALYKSFKQFCMAYVMFLSYTFLLGGACLGVLGLLDANITGLVTLSYSYKVPVGLIIFIIWIYVRIIAEIAKYINRKKEVSTFLYNIQVENEGQKLDLSAFLDSGNHLFDEVYALPVVVVNERIFYKLFPKLKNSNIKIEKQYNAHYIYYSTVSGDNQKMLVAEPSKFSIVLSEGEVKINKKVMIGLSNIKLESCYDCLLHPQII